MSKRGSPRQKRLDDAVKQMWAQLCQGFTFEVGAVLSRESETSEAVMLLRKKHPEVQLTLQSNAWVVSLGKTPMVSAVAWDQLSKGGYTPGNEVSKEMFFAAHAHFVRRNDNGTAEDVSEKADAADRKRHKIVLR